MTNRVMTLHPEGKQGVAIDAQKYETIRNAIVQALDEATTLTFTELTETVRNTHDATFDGSIPWYVTTVKLDLEARGVIERVDGSSPQRLQLASSE